MAGLSDYDTDRVEKWILDQEFFSTRSITDMMTKKNIAPCSYFSKVSYLKPIIDALIDMRKIKRIKKGQYERSVG